jgi:hypothetical protein
MKQQPPAVIIPVAALRLLEEAEDRMDAEEIERLLADREDGFLTLDEAEQELDL